MGPNGEPIRDEVNRLPGAVVLEFGASWCGHCIAIAPDVLRMLQRYPDVRHLKIEDGRGKPLGRSFRVNLWPTFVFLHKGEVVAQVVRPEVAELEEGFEMLAGHSETGTD